MRETQSQKPGTQNQRWGISLFFSLWLPVSGFLLLTIGCASAPMIEVAPDFQERRPAVVAVLPINNATANMEAPEKFQALVEEGMEARGYVILPSNQVKERLEVKGIHYAGELGLYTKQEIREIVGADGLLFVTLLDWNKTYLLYYYNLRVGASFELYDGKSGERLWQTQQEVLEQLIVTDSDQVKEAWALHLFTFFEPYARKLVFMSLETLPEGPRYSGDRWRSILRPLPARPTSRRRRHY